jgi:hypothetical protein
MGLIRCREAFAIFRNEQKEILTEDGTWAEESSCAGIFNAALFDTLEEADAHCPSDGVVTHTIRAKPIRPLLFGELLDKLQRLCSEHGRDTAVITHDHAAFSVLGFDPERRCVLLDVIAAEDEWLEEEDDF